MRLLHNVFSWKHLNTLVAANVNNEIAVAPGLVSALYEVDTTGTRGAAVHDDAGTARNVGTK